MRRVNLVGKKVGELTIISHHHTDTMVNHWLAECSCGNFRVITSRDATLRAVKYCRDCGKIAKTSGQKFRRIQ